jgi:hypothetical protein
MYSVTTTVPVDSCRSCTAFLPSSSAPQTENAAICLVLKDYYSKQQSMLTIPRSNNSGQALLCQKFCNTIAYALVGCRKRYC